MSRQSQSRMAREVFGAGVVPPTLMEAADALAEAVREGIFGATRDVERRTSEAGFTDPREWVEDRLEKYDRARELVGV